MSNAQDKNNPWSIELGANAVDFFPTGADSGRFNERSADGQQQVGNIFQELSETLNEFEFWSI